MLRNLFLLQNRVSLRDFSALSQAFLLARYNEKYCTEPLFFVK